MRRLALMLRAISPMNLKMPALKGVLEGLGYAEPQTLLTSGNAVFGTAEPAAKVETAVENALAAEVGLKTDAFVRDLGQLKAAMAANPFEDQARDDPSHLLVMFIRGAPAGDLAGLERYCAAGERLAMGPGCVFMSFPSGIGTSKLSINAVEKALSVRGTGRNWNTVRRLAERLSP